MTKRQTLAMAHAAFVELTSFLALAVARPDAFGVEQAEQLELCLVEALKGIRNLKRDLGDPPWN